jgi:hypothetical protein
VAHFDPDRSPTSAAGWIAVIGLNRAHRQGRVRQEPVRIVVSDASTERATRGTRRGDGPAAGHTGGADRTTLLVHPQVLGDFLDYSVLDDADALVEALDLDGVLQVASFHPHYQFAGTEPDDAVNLTNHAPYPILHLLREDSVDRAVAAYPEPDSIIVRNVATMQDLGIEVSSNCCGADATGWLLLPALIVFRIDTGETTMEGTGMAIYFRRDGGADHRRPQPRQAPQRKHLPNRPRRPSSTEPA